MSVVPAIIPSGLPGKRVDAQRAGITMTAFMETFDSKPLAVGRSPLAEKTANRQQPTAISAADRVLMRRLTISVAALFLLTAAFARLDLLYSHKFFDVTGRAQWV